MPSGFFTITDCAGCCDEPPVDCTFTEATVVISGTTIPCDGPCGTFDGGDIEIVSGDINGAFNLTGPAGNVQYFEADRFVFRLYGVGSGCTGDFTELEGGFLLLLNCYTDEGFEPLGATAYITINDPPELFYQIFNIGDPTPPEDRFSFGEAVSICDGNLTASL